MRFGRGLRYFGSILFIVGMILYLPVAVYVPALTFNQVSGVSIHIVTPVVCLVCIFYTCVGGLKAVIWTDVVQSFVMYGSVLAICIKGTLDVGGLDVVWQRNAASGRLNAPDMTWDPTVRLSIAAVLIGGSLHKIQSSAINQVSIQRFLSLPNYKKAQHTMVVFTVLLIFLLLCCCYMGLLAFAIYHDCDPLSTKLARASDQLPSLLVMHTLGSIPGLPGLFVAGVFSAALSSLSTGLNSLSCVISQDIVNACIKKPLTERQTAILLRVIVLTFGLLCIALVGVVEKLGMVLQLASMTGAVTMGPLLAVYTMGVCLPWINGKSALTGCVVSFLTFSWICSNAQIGQMNGDIRHPKLPVSVEGCSYTFDNVTAWHEIHDFKPSTAAERNIYHLSFLWYTAFGALLSVLVAAVATLAFGTTNLDELDPVLVAPFMRRYLPKEAAYLSVSLEDIFNRKCEILDIDEENSSLETAKYFERRFSRRMRLFGAALFTTKAVIWMPIAIYVPALTFNQVSGIDLHIISPIVIGICTFYTTVGGIKGVVWTDVIQSFVMCGSLAVLMVKGTYDAGGLGELWRLNKEGGRLNTPELTWDPTVRMSILSVIVGGTFFKLQGSSINQPAIQRFMSLPSLQHIKRTLCIFTIGITLLYLASVYVGLVAFATYHECDPMSTGLAQARDQLVPLLVMKTLGVFPGLPGLFVAGVFSAALSSLSTLLNSLAAVILEDFVKPNVRTPLSERGTAIVMRSVVVFFGIGSIGLVYVVEKMGMVLQLSATMVSILYGPMLGIFTVGMLMPWIKEPSVLAGSIVSVLCMAWICINAQLASITGTFRHTRLPVSVAGCDYEFDMTRYLNSTAEHEPTESTAIYHISFLWYTGLGAALTIVGSHLASLIFGLNDLHEVDEKLLAPFLARYLKKRRKYWSVHTRDQWGAKLERAVKPVVTFEKTTP